MLMHSVASDSGKLGMNPYCLRLGIYYTKSLIGKLPAYISVSSTQVNLNM